MLRVVGTVAPDVTARLASAAKLQSLAELVPWGGTIVEVVTQDEFTHDIVVAHGGGDFLVFDTT